ncbi:MAG: FixH family protein [Chloracidobacterium sp.]|nr:FixH family protein [Chloracidobacterium sp.]
MKKTFLIIGSVTLFSIIVSIAACGSGSSSVSVPSGKSIATGPAGNNLTATISNADGSLKKGQQEFTLTFTDASGKPVDVGSVALNYRMAAMGSMAEMNNGATFTTTGTLGMYKGKVNIDMAGAWQAQITYEGPAGKGAFSLPVTAR